MTQRKTPNSTTCSTGDGGCNSSEYVESLISYKQQQPISGGHAANGGEVRAVVQSVTLSSQATSGKSAAQHRALLNGGNNTLEHQGSSDPWDTMDSDQLAAAIDEHHIMYHQAGGNNLHEMQNYDHLAGGGHQHSFVGGQNLMRASLNHHHTTPIPKISAPVLLKGPRARLAAATSNNQQPIGGGPTTASSSTHSSSYDTDDPNVEIHSDNEIFGDEDQESRHEHDASSLSLRQQQQQQHHLHRLHNHHHH